MGTLERIIYVYATLTRQFSLVSAVVILKAFFNWIEKLAFVSHGVGDADSASIPDDPLLLLTAADAAPAEAGKTGSGADARQPPSSDELQTHWTLYHIQVGGNVISILAGVMCGEVARWASLGMRAYWHN
jgi:hypothetical protein